MRECPENAPSVPPDAVETGGEHLWDDWLNKALPPTTYRARKQFSMDHPPIVYDTHKIDLKLPVVCEACNHGWMSTLTAKVKDRFGRSMLDGEPFSLGARDAALLTAFSFMKAVVTNHCNDIHEPFFTRAARERFGSSLVLPSFLKAWFAAYEGDRRISTKSRFSVFGMNSPSGLLHRIEFSSFTYIVGKLTLQLLTPRWKYVSDRGKRPLSLTPNVYWEQAATLFWPHDGGFLSWPPPKHLADDTIEAFVERFGDPVNVPIG